MSNAGTTEVNGIYYHMPEFDDTLVQGKPKYVIKSEDLLKIFTFYILNKKGFQIKIIFEIDLF